MVHMILLGFNAIVLFLWVKERGCVCVCGVISSNSSSSSSRGGGVVLKLPEYTNYKE